MICDNAKTFAVSTTEFGLGLFWYSAMSLQSAEISATKEGSKSDAYENRTKTAKCGGLETNGPIERF
jgi:hypothetical protein